MYRGNRTTESQYIDVTITTVHDNGTVSCNCNGREFDFDEIPSTLDPRVHQEGMVGVVGFAFGNQYLPFLMGDLRSHKVVQPTNFVPIVSYVIYLYDWSTFRGGVRQNFVSGLPGLIFDIEDTGIVSTRMDMFSKNGPVVGLLYYRQTVGETENVEIISVKNFNGEYSADATYRDEFYSIPPYVTIDENTDYFFESRVSDITGTGKSYAIGNPFGTFLYASETNQLIYLKRWSIASGANTDHQDRGQILTIDGISGSDPGDPASLNGTIVDSINLLEKDFILDEGCVVAGDKLVKTFLLFGGSFTANNKKVICMDSQSNYANAWTWDPLTLWTGTGESSSLRKICSNPMFTVIFTDTNKNLLLNTTSSPTGGSFVDFPANATRSALLPGSPGCYLSGIKSVVLAIVGRVACDHTLYAWTNPTGFGYSRFRTTGLGPQYQFEISSIGSGGSTAIVGFRKPFLSDSSLTTGLPASGLWANSSTPNTSDYEITFSPNSSKLYNWLVALDTDETSTTYGQVKWEYNFPVLTSTDSSNYFVDTDSFGKTTTALSTIGGRLVTEYTTSGHVMGNLIYSTDVVFPDQIHSTTYVPIDPLVGNTSVSFGIMNSYTNYICWPPQARYYWDPISFTKTGDEAGTTGDDMSTVNIVSDNNDNVYGVYLQPYIIVSCANMFPKNDAYQPIRSGATTSVSPAFKYNTLYNSYESDLETLIPDQIKFYGVESGTGTGMQADGSGTPSMTHDMTLYGEPHNLCKFKSFLGKWNNQGELVKKIELTTYMDERIDNSPSLAGQIPYPGCTLRICPSSVGIFILRLIRLPIKTGLREPSLRPTKHSNSFIGPTFVNSSFMAHTFNSKAVIELRHSTTLEVIWQETIFDPTSIEPAWLCGCSMMLSESSSEIAGDTIGPWVIGRVDYTKNHTPKALWQTFPADLSAGIFRTSKIFTCDKDGNVKTRNANPGVLGEDENIDFGSNGFFPYDFVNSTSFSNGYIRLDQTALMNGTAHYTALRVGESSKFDIYGYGNNIPPV